MTLESLACRRALRLMLLLMSLGLAPIPVCAQPVAEGRVAISGLAGVMGNRQTVQTEDPNGLLQLGTVGFTSVIYGLEGTYFITPRFGLGAVVSYQRISFDARERDAMAKLAGGYYGPMAQFRLPFDDRSSFVLVVSGGGTRTIVINHNTGIANEVNLDGVGQYWLAGGGLSFRVATNATLDAGVRYQSSTYRSPDAGRSGRATSAGLLTGIGFTVYFK